MTEPLVLVPGMMCDHRVFEPQIRALGQERAVTVVPVASGERIEEIAQFLLDQLPERFALAGLSMGGIVAMELLKRVPKRITRLCLMASSPLPEPPAQAAAREPLIVGARAGRLDEVMGEAMRPEFLAPGPQRIEVMATVRGMARDLGADVFIRQSRALQRRPDQQSTLRKCRVPTLILCGAHDTLTPVRRHEFMAGLIPDARLQVLPDAGHLPTLETPEAVTQAFRDWLEMPVVLR